jgi:hypothetical protein
VVVEAAVADDALVVAGAAVEAGAPADRSSPEEPQPVAATASSTAEASRPMVRHIGAPLVCGVPMP